MDDHTQFERLMTAKGAVLPDTKFSTREISYRLFFRFKLFVFCSIAVPIIALILTRMVPPTYKATSKIIIKESDLVTPFSNGIVTSRNQGLSGQSNVEIMRSLPICETIVKKLDLNRADMAKSAFKVILKRGAALYYFFKKNDAQEENALSNKGVDPRITRLAEDLKDTITPKIIQKGSNTPFAKDELIEVEVASFNRKKVALITNTLCQEFINEFYRIYESEALQAYEYLGKQIAVTRRQIDADKKEKGKLTGQEWSERNINTNPIVERIARQVAELEKDYFRLKTLYSSTSPEVKKAKAELDAAVERLSDYRATESADAILNILTEKRRAAYMALQIYRNRLVPISIVEEAVMPMKSSLAIFSRYIIAGGAGLVAGAVIGFILVMFFSAIDNRLYTPWDIGRSTGLEVIGSIVESPDVPELNINPSASPAIPTENAILDMLGMLDLMKAEKGRVLLVTSPAKDEGKTTVAFQAAMALAQDKRAKTLLIDANFKHPDLSTKFELARNDSSKTDLKETASSSPPSKGMVDVLVGEAGINEVIYSFNNENFDIVLSGSKQRRQQVGFYKKSLRAAFDTLRDQYDLIVVDAPGLLSSVDSALFASEADSVVLVIRAGLTRLETIENAKTVLARSDSEAVGAILNFRKFPVPKIFYG